MAKASDALRLRIRSTSWRRLFGASACALFAVSIGGCVPCGVLTAREPLLSTSSGGFFIWSLNLCLIGSNSRAAKSNEAYQPTALGLEKTETGWKGHTLNTLLPGFDNRCSSHRALLR